MAGHERQDDARRPGDALDRAIDDAVEATLRAGPVDLRAKVMARMDEPAASTHGRFRRFSLPSLLLRPAALPAIGALLLVAGVAVLWEHADQQLSHIRPSSAAGGAVAAGHAPRPTVPGAARPGPEEMAAARQAAAPPAPAVPPARVAAPAGVATARRGGVAMRDTRIYAASWLEMNAATDAGRPAGASVVPADEARTEPTLPGAPAGDLGEPIAPMPRLRPIEITPIATPPIDVAPPVSTLGKPVSTLADEAGRDLQDPGKPGGM